MDRNTVNFAYFYFASKMCQKRYTTDFVTIM